MESTFEFIQYNIAYAPFIIFGLLLLAGLNIPVSEDLMLYISAIIAAKNPDFLYQMFLAVFLGAYLSDLICYWVMGRYLGNKIFKIKFFANFLNKKRLDHIHHYYENYGILTLFLGRFIPFGVRNGLFFTAGLSKMNAWKFSVTDFFASLFSCSLFFTLYFNFGELAINYIRKANTLLFGIFIIFLIAFYLYFKRRNKSPSH